MIKRLVITGYKAHELGIFNNKHEGIPIIKKALENRLLPLIESGLEWMIISGQPGVETWAAETVIELQESYPDLKYAVITPFLEQEKNWNETKKDAYQFIVSNADFTTALTKRPYEAPWQFIERDKFLLRNSDALLIVYDEENEGSPKFMKKMAMKFADTTNYEVLTITADDLQLVAEDLQRQDWD
ncbi:DUF1273 domain-containing protein [Sporosarcina sp. USHLN248]|uniref:DUF1273 domain-containing protein n=1 Tax=Sporosarcina sp. USHLN248 TaxID=3081300 RepID=UPI003018EFF0